MAKKPKTKKAKISPKLLLSRPVENWTRGNWDNQEERDAYYTTIGPDLIRVCLSRNKKIDCQVNSVEAKGKFKKVWEHLHLNAGKMPRQGDKP